MNAPLPTNSPVSAVFETWEGRTQYTVPLEEPAPHARDQHNAMVAA